MLDPKIAAAVQEVGTVIGESDACVGLPYLYFTLAVAAVHSAAGYNAGGLVPALRQATSAS